MKLRFDFKSVGVQFPGGVEALIRFLEIVSIDLQAVTTMTVDVDVIVINLENGDFLEISDNAGGFGTACENLSSQLRIHPPIHKRFPVVEGVTMRI